MAGIRLLGGLLRLDALQPAGFTAAQLAEHAGVEQETARAYLNPEKGPGYAEAVLGVKAASGAYGRGRPANLYRLRSDRRASLIQRLSEMRRELDSVEGLPGPSAAKLFGPLDLLETVLEELERRGDSEDAWRERFAAAQLEFEGARADLRALEAKSSPEAEPFARKLGRLADRLEVAKALGPQDPMRWLRDLIGRWADKAHTPAQVQPSTSGAWAAFEPTLLLFDGIPTNDPLTAELVKSCQSAAVRVVVFNVANMKPQKRANLYGTLDRLRTATPLALSDFVLTFDERTPLGRSLAEEFRTLKELGVWQRRAPAKKGNCKHSYLDAVRRFYVWESEALSGSSWNAEPRRTLLAKRLTFALRAVDTAESVKEIPRPVFADPNEHKVLDAAWDLASNLMGDVICLEAESPLAEAVSSVPLLRINQHRSSGV